MNDNKEGCIELVKFSEDMSKRINNNKYKDEANGVRGWKLQSEVKSVRLMHKDMAEFETALYEHLEALENNTESLYTESELYKEGLDVACRVMFLCDRLGLLNLDE